MKDETVEISIIAPAFNEQECLPELTSAIRSAMTGLESSYEIILVDDGSKDRTADVIRQLTQEFAEVRGCFHRMNCGQSAALATGFRYAKGDIIVTLDADMQNPPCEIPRLLNLLTESADAVCGVRTKRNDTPIRRLSSKIANGYRDWITGIPVKDSGCNLRVMRRSAIRELLIFNGTHRFITSMLKLKGLNVIEEPIAHEKRIAGTSKYGIGNRMWRGIEDCFAMRWYRKRCFPVNRTDP